MSSPDAFQAAVLRELGGALSIEQIAAPELALGQVLVRLDYSGVCRSQLMEVRGLRGADAWLPHLLGHEGSGEVIHTGPGVTKVAAGDQVILGWIKGAGLDAPGAIYGSDAGPVNSGPVTTFSEYVVAAESRVYPQPSVITGPSAVLYGCALLTGAGMAINEIDLGSHDSVLVLGLGGVGMAALIGALSRCPAQVIAADPSAAKRALASRLGARHVLDPTAVDFLATVRDLTGGGADFCLEAAGSIQTIELGFACLRPKSGSLVFASHPAAGELISLDPHDLIQGKSIRGSWGGACVPERDIPRIATAVQELGIDLEILLERSYLLGSISEAFTDLEAGTVVRPYIDLRPQGVAGA
ncbi:MAG: zinc-binding dehydrogenase [Actinomycetota bacterium]|nr:zinc-binding dehydrogenase [Actinomycetota bacterium]